MFLKILLSVYLMVQFSMAQEADCTGQSECYKDNNDSAGEGTDPNDEGETNCTEQSECDEDNIDYEKEAPDSNDEGVIDHKDIVPCDIISTDQYEVQQLIVDCHNENRKHVNPPARNMLKLAWNKEIQESAEIWAKKCYFNHSHASERILNGSVLGENILTSPVCVNWDLVIEQWDKEGEDFIYGVGPKNDAITGHYTQLVAAATHKVGCAVAECPDEGNTYRFFVCQYSPAGNQPHLGNQPYEQGNPCGACEKECEEGLCLNFCSYEDKVKNCKNVKLANMCEKYKAQCGATCDCEGKIS